MYKYIAKSKDGQVVKGEVDASSRDRAVSMISAMGLRVHLPISQLPLMMHLSLVLPVLHLTSSMVALLP